MPTASSASASPDDESYTYIVTPEVAETLFREVHGRQLNTMQPVYQLPADADEIKRLEYFHKMMYMVMGDKNHVGPVEDVLNVPSDRKKRILDIGTGSGLWAIQIADEFPDVEVVGVDLAPIQPEMVPPNCDFELFDAQLIPYPNEYFDIVHARCVNNGMKNYPLFLEEVARILRPGGLVILIESEIKPLSEGKQPIEAGPRGGAPGWHAFWEQYRRCLAGNHIDTTVPTRLGSLLRATGAFNDVVAQEAIVPVGFWPKDQGLLTVAQFAWMDHDSFIPAVRPLFLSYGLSEFRVKILIEDAQQDLYYPLTRPYSCVHVSQARKVTNWTAPRRRTRRFR
ncbi:S-adenosyl-L-methionine-dependent methyltransferase [Phellopilus nigrolimitatus]|nr:S-adenosyl-L-methionine-dependent methyltransferase [Phellopilus nigrolimitatus]